MPKQHFIAANSYEGCSHKHRTAEAAGKCATRFQDAKLHVYRIWYEGKKRRYERVKQ
jgi:hypothetical protein